VSLGREKTILILNFLNKLAEWNFTNAVKNAELVDDFPKQVYYHTLSLSKRFGNLGTCQREGSVFNQIPNSVKIILDMLDPWLVEYLRKEENGIGLETFCGKYK